MNEDPLLEEAKEWSQKQGYVSVSYIQRAMRIGYTRASRLVDLMIEQGFCEAEYAEGKGYRALIFEKCNHETAIVLESFGAVDKLQCTWACGKIYWTVREKITTREVTEEEARDIMPFHHTVGCDLNMQVGGHHNFCECPCHVPFDDLSPVSEAESSDTFKAGGS